MVDQHLESDAQLTVAAIRQPISLADQFGVIEVDPTNTAKIGAWREKPSDPVGLPDSPGEVLASMGNYVFDAHALIEAVTQDHDTEGSKHDMGGDIVAEFVGRGTAHVYDFKDNDVPGHTDRDRGYWRDVGTLDSYFDAHMDLISVHPVFNLYNFDWPIYTDYGPQPPAKFVHGHGDRIGEALSSAVSPGVVVSGAQVNMSVLSPRVHVHSYATISESVLLDGVEVGRYAVIRRAIIDKNVVVPEYCRIGVDHHHDRARGFHVTENGIVVIGKGQKVPV
jgi:glucose-1-phosphate adenylyltransferase